MQLKFENDRTAMNGSAWAASPFFNVIIHFFLRHPHVDHKIMPSNINIISNVLFPLSTCPV